MTQAYGNNISYEEFLPYVLQYVPDASEMVATEAIKNACIEFCEKTYIWQYVIPPIGVVANQSNYVMPTPDGTKSVGPIQVYYDTSLLIPKSPDELADIYRMGNWQDLTGRPQYVTRIIKPEVVLVPTPYENVPATLYIRTALAPTRDSTEIDSEIFEQWAEAIAWGARARLLAQDRQDYYDKQGSIDAAKMFNYHINRARIQMNKGITRGSTRTEFQRWA